MDSPEKIVNDLISRASQPLIDLNDIKNGVVNTDIAKMMASVRTLLNLHMMMIASSGIKEEDLIATFKSVVDMSRTSNDKHRSIAEQMLFTCSRAAATKSAVGCLTAVYDEKGENTVEISLSVVGNLEVIRETAEDLIRKIKDTRG